MIFFETEAENKLNKWIDENKIQQIIVIDDVNTHKYCLPILEKKLNFPFKTITIPNGDQNKNIATLQNIWKELMLHNVDRKSLIINLGGGVVTDMGGFAASTFKRGLNFIHIPTSLLGMVDASIGGKNGINFMGAKNQLGTIQKPKMILIWEHFLKTLNFNELKSGYAEMLKHGLIADYDYWEELLFSFPDKNIGELIKKSIEIKSNIVNSDPFEKTIRKSLNFGHTLGHAIESYSHEIKQPLKHGHAIALGMILASHLSYNCKLINYTFVKYIKNEILNIYDLPDFLKDNASNIIKYLKFDKKNSHGKINFVLLSGKGKVQIDQTVNESLYNEAFDFLYSNE